jgi:hypothetical protein
MKYSFILLIALIALATAASSCKTEGCTDSMAVNYDPEARYDDRSCRYVKGCVDCLALNYDSEAISSDGSCEYATIDHLTTYTVIDSIVDEDDFVTRDTYNITLSRDTCGFYNVVLTHYAGLKFSDSTTQVQVTGELINDTLFIPEQTVLGVTNTANADKITVLESKAYYKHDSVFLPLIYSDRFEDFYGFLSGPIKI